MARKINDFQSMNNNVLGVWNRVKPFNDEIVGMEVLQEEKLSSVYRLKTAEYSKPNIIAKRAVHKHILREKNAYENIFPFISILTPYYFGFIEDKNKDFAWLFIEDVGGENYSPHSKEHRILGGEWLGLMHIYTSEFDQRLKKCDRDLHYWEQFVSKAIEILSTNLSNPSLKKDDVTLIRTIIGYCETIKHYWFQLQYFYYEMPQVFIHGDFKVDNMQVITTPLEKKSLCVFDWGESGWGTPALDVATFLNYPVNPDISAYCRVTQKYWPIFNASSVQRIGYIGEIFRSIRSIRWEAENLQYQWVETSISTLKCYKWWLEDIIDAAPWSNDYLLRTKNRIIKARNWN